jgi:hypothetical protein
LKCLPAGRTAPARSERRAAHLRTTFMNDTPFLEKRRNGYFIIQDTGQISRLADC